MTTFEQFNLPISVQKAITDLGFIHPTPIQEKSFSVIMSGRDMMGIAQTGTGKTFAYLLPLLKLYKFTPTNTPKIVILVPTRELVVQVEPNIDDISKNIISVLVNILDKQYLLKTRTLVLYHYDDIIPRSSHNYDVLEPWYYIIMMI